MSNVPFILIVTILVVASATTGLYSSQEEQLLIPEELWGIPLSQARILEDINQDGRTDFLFIDQECIYISYQTETGTFSEIEAINIPMAGAIDIADVFPGDEKEICILNGQGISCIQKKNGVWDRTPQLIIASPSIYSIREVQYSRREKFAVDLDCDGIPEFIVFDFKVIRIYRRDHKGIYRLSQEFQVQPRTILNHEGLKSRANPLGNLVQSGSLSLARNSWPVWVRSFKWSHTIVWGDLLIADVNQDSRLELVRIERKTQESASEKRLIWEYSVHSLGEDNLFSKEPQWIIRDPHGVWISPNSVDIRGIGKRDLLKLEIKSEGGLLQKPRVRMDLILEPEHGDYPLAPIQTWETSDAPLGALPLSDVNGDGFMELILLRPMTTGLSLGSILRKYVEKSIDIEIKILPFQMGTGWVSAGMIVKKVKTSFFAGVPISLTGDFNGDGAMDLMVINGKEIAIDIFDRQRRRFSPLCKIRIEIPHSTAYELMDLDGDHKSEIILYLHDRIQIIKPSVHHDGRLP